MTHSTELHATDTHAMRDPRALIRDLSHYRQADTRRSVFELIVTAVPFVLLWIATWAALDAGHWIGLVLTVPAAGFLLRLFMIQHDCGHRSFFHNRKTNDRVGRILGVLTFTPYDFWQHTHAQHHAASGNLDRRGVGDIDTLTVREFRALKPWQRLVYRLYRHPFVMFGIGPAYLFIIRHRLPVGLIGSGWRAWMSAMSTNAAILIAAAAMVWLVGLGPFLLVQLPITALAASIGVWLFYVQHQFEHTHWDHDDAWTFPDAALHGSSHYDLPQPLRWFTANIGVHHVHHLASRIPFYRLPDVLRDHPEFRTIGRLTLLESLKCVRLVLWDDETRRLISFRDARALGA